jgi:hypothetical protein
MMINAALSGNQAGLPGNVIFQQTKRELQHKDQIMIGKGTLAAL